MRLSNIYFRKSTFHRMSSAHTQQRTPSPCESLHLSSSSLASLATGSLPSGVGSTSGVGGDPMTHYVVRVGDLRVLDRIAASRVNTVLHAQRRTELSGVGDEKCGRNVDVIRASATVWRAAPSLVPHRISTDFVKELEAEGKVSIQPLQVNLDQVGISFLR